jgi:hypothetical protein
MSKTEPSYLPYFQFKPSDWLTGDIQYCSLEAKGIFSDICAFYWQRKCKMTHQELHKKYKEHLLLEELIAEGVIKVEENEVIIEFLIDQYADIYKSHKRNVINGRKGAEVKKQNALLAELKTEAPVQVLKLDKPEETKYFFYVGMQLFKTKVSDYVKNEMQIHVNEFMIQMKPVTTEQVLAKMDSTCAGYQFNNHNHVIKTFDSIAKELKNGDRFNKKADEPTKLSYEIGKRK